MATRRKGDSHCKGLESTAGDSSLQEVAFSMLTEVPERPLASMEKTVFLLSSGVVAKRQLQLMLGTLVKKHSARFLVVLKQYTLDGSVIIELTGVPAWQHAISAPIEGVLSRLKWCFNEVISSWVGGCAEDASQEGC